VIIISSGSDILGTHPKSHRLAQETSVWWTPQHHPDTHGRNLTREGYPVVSLLSSKIGGPEGFAPILSSGELPCEGQLHRKYFHRVGFQIFFKCFLYVLWNEWFLRWSECKSCHQPPHIKITQLQENVHRHSWALDMDGHWLESSSSAL